MSPAVSSVASAPPRGPTAEPKASAPAREQTSSFAAALSPPPQPQAPHAELAEPPPAPLPDSSMPAEEPTADDPSLPEDLPSPPPDETPLAPLHADTSRRAPRADPLDPAARHAAQLAPPMLSMSAPVDASPGAGAPPPPEALANASLETLLPELVRKVAWSGDGKRGSMRLELGKGALAGGVVTVHADAGRVRVELDAPVGTDTAAWRQRLAERLALRGVDVEELEVK